jgi:hypothetical protein
MCRRHPWLGHWEARLPAIGEGTPSLPTATLPLPQSCPKATSLPTLSLLEACFSSGKVRFPVASGPPLHHSSHATFSHLLPLPPFPPLIVGMPAAGNTAILSTFALTPSLSASLQQAAAALALQAPILLIGPTACGKSSLVELLASATGNQKSLLRIQMGDQTDPKVPIRFRSLARSLTAGRSRCGPNLPPACRSSSAPTCAQRSRVSFATKKVS